MVGYIVRATGRGEREVLERLRAEHKRPGSTVAAALMAAGVRPYEWSPGMEAFYGSTDAFIFELALWNIHPMKCTLRARVATHLRRWGRGLARGPTLDVLCLGDGLGFDSRRLADGGHRVTYMEFPGPSERFARDLFSRRPPGAAGSVQVVTDPAQLGTGCYDAILCLDVLEHVPDVPAMVASLAGRLRPPRGPDPGGRLLVSSPFSLIHPAYATHLRANRRYSGSLRLYTRAGLRPARAWPFWDPVVLEPRTGFSSAELGARLAAAPWGLYQSVGRWSAVPFWWQHWLRRATGRWFAGDAPEPRR